jgi:hypothetical protein
VAAGSCGHYVSRCTTVAHHRAADRGADTGGHWLVPVAGVAAVAGWRGYRLDVRRRPIAA